MDAINCEMLLLAWSESHTRGATITLQLADPDELLPFKAMTVGKKGMAGQRLAVAIVEICDDEGGDLARMAGIFCGNPAFQGWIQEEFRGHLEDSKRSPGWAEFAANQEFLAREIVLFVCGHIDSRRELDHFPEAAKLFHNKIREPWLAYQKERGL